SSFVDEGDQWSVTDFNKSIQLPGDLGTRMNMAFAEVLQQHAKAVIIGSDCASLTPTIVRAAFEALDTHDFVIGPAEDGGYYLMGMNALSPWVFEDIAWSTETVLAQTLQKIVTHQKTYQLLPELSDIDYEEDWEKHGWAL
ncbi:MAG: TIGR04282 family arsenosugar biosynthesis glycosyltransferase, partial [Phaeodactylibacter sp.]|nr:TIGR04282 family arsenosugar biosynthesis glycosyltransferase [Phaeodactylibacter sp.]